MGLGAVTRVPAPAEHITDLYLLSWTHREAALLHMTQRDDGAATLDQDVIPGECHPACCGAPQLSQGVTDRGQSTIGRVVGLAFVGGYDKAVDRGKNWASEAGESLDGLRLHQRAGSPSIGDGNEVDGVGRGEPACAVTRNPVRRAVLNKPATSEGIG